MQSDYPISACHKSNGKNQQHGDVVGENIPML